jgi:hypothetical protein
MFLRFRQVRRRNGRLSRREPPRRRQVKNEHLAFLGSVALPEPIAARERMRFWTQLDGRFRAIHARRPDRVSPDDERKVLAAIHARIPAPTEADERRVQVEAARAVVDFWEQVRDELGPNSKLNQDRRKVIGTLEKQLAEACVMREAASRQLATAQAHVVELTRGKRAARVDDPAMADRVRPEPSRAAS